jgi:hypothetical protein
LGYSPNKLSTAYYAGQNPSEPSMAFLLAKAWQAKSLKMKWEKLMSSQVAPPPPKRARALPVMATKPQFKKAQKAGLISALLSRRLGRARLLPIKIPSRKPFPPPLVWNPPSDAKS